jgi:hypothetical protein
LNKERGITVSRLSDLEKGGEAMKRLMFIGLAVTLALSVVWAPAVAAEGPYPINIIKTIGPDCPEETFTFEAYRDMNNNGILDFVEPWPDMLVGTVDITGAGTGTIYTDFKGVTIIHEVLMAGSVYDQAPDQLVQVPCSDDVYFDNVCRPPELCDLVILKTDTDGGFLPGSCFTITPDPSTGTDSFTLCDNDANDECADVGVLCLSGLICGLEVTVEETTVPDGYVGADPQTALIGETPELTFVNTEEKCELTIYKVDESGDPLADACFTITPDPRTGADSLVLCDNDANDECAAVGVLCLSGLICGLEVTVEETTVPDGYVGAGPQTAIIGETPELTFENTREMDCGTVCAAQENPGEFLFHDDQSNWFTWIYYGIGSGTEADPYEYPIYTGQTHLCGTLYVYDDGSHIFVNYVLTDMDGCTLAGLSEYHLQVDRTFNHLARRVLNPAGEPVPGSCEYIDYFDPMVSETGWIECTNDNISRWTTAYIFAHGVGCYFCP